HFNIPALIQIAESLRASGRQWPENATYNGGFFDKAMALCESMRKPVIATISGTALAGAFEFAVQHGDSQHRPSLKNGRVPQAPGPAAFARRVPYIITFQIAVRTTI
ncbi:MAG: hypothetical protein QOF56_1736, partial [Acidobacteriaceae bacterium]|nr:hypothetical protein [Acidobacteriaceae bacterium]